MKRTAAILFLCICLFNPFGYLALHWYMEYRTQCFFERQTAKGLYARDDVVEIAIPISLTDVDDGDTFEQVTGQVKFEEKAYNYVELKITSHTLFLKCLPNYKHTKLVTYNIICVKDIKDIPVPKKDHLPCNNAYFMRGCIALFQNPEITIPVVAMVQHSTPYLKELIDRPIDLPKQPPRQYC